MNHDRSAQLDNISFAVMLGRPPARQGRILCLTILIALCGTRDSGANTVYELVSFPTLQSGYSVTGTITTDGTLGSISDIHIVDSSITSVIDGVNTYQNVHPNDTFSTVNLIATTTGIFLPASPPGTPSPQFTIASTGYDTVQIQYDYIQTAPGTTNLQYYGSVDHPLTLTQLWSISGTNLLGLTGEPWMIARAVPEPGTFAMLACGVATGLLLWRRK
jgi:hypothetical protein